MTAQKGKDLLLKIHNGSTYETVAGLRRGASGRIRLGAKRRLSSAIDDPEQTA